MFYTKKKREELIGRFINLSQSIAKIETMVRSYSEMMLEQISNISNDLTETKKVLSDIKETVSCVKTDVEDTFNRLENVDRHIEHLSAAEYAAKLLEVEKFAEEMERLVKVVDLLNDTIHENILNESISLEDING
jgi:vacuolar-type H+-ATPase subunit D/Vma8